MTRPVFKETLMKAAAMGADHRSDDAADTATLMKAIPADEFSYGSVQAIWSGADHVDATVTVEVTNDPAAADASFIAKPGATVLTLNAAAGKTYISFGPGVIGETWYRLKYAKGSNTTGALSLYANFKG